MVASPQMIQELEKALKKERSFQRLWDTAQAWLTIAEQSQEICDLNRALELFRLAAKQKTAHPPFLASFGEALLLYGSFSGDPAFVREGLEILRQAIEKKQNHAWLHYALGHKLLYDLTGMRDDFDRADSVFQRAIMSYPTPGTLWLNWGLLFLESGWRRRFLPEIETALEKLTSLKMDDCDPTSVTAYLGEGLALLGLFVDDLRLIHDGKDKVVRLLPQHEHYPELLVAAGMIQLIEGLYFSEARFFAASLDYFRKALELQCHDLRAAHGLYQVNLAWGVTMRDPVRIHDACLAIERMVTLRPFSSTYYIEWGAALLRLCHFEGDSLEQQAICEEAIDKLRQAVSMQGDLEAQYQLGIALDLLGDITGVEEYFEEAIEILSGLHLRMPEDLQITFHLGLALSHYGEIASNIETLYEAVHIFEELLVRDSEDDETLCHLGYTQLLLAEHIYDENHPESSCELEAEAERHLIRAAALGNGESHYHLACLYSLLEMTERSLEYLKRADRAHALPSDEGLWSDHWIENLRQTEGFSRFMEERHG